MLNKNIYVAATDQHVGKTTSTLGLVAAFRSYGIGSIGYCKPVGQEISDLFKQQVDKDAYLFSKIMGFELQPDLHSPVILGKGATTAFLDNPEAYNFEERLLAAADELGKRHKLIVYEGTGHPGVGSIVNLSNATVAKKLNAHVVMVVEGGIGRAIDRLDLSLSPFREAGVPIVGVIVNKVIPKKREKIEHYLKKKLDQMNVPLLGIIPFDKTMSYPIMQTVRRAIKGKFVTNEQKCINSVEKLVPGSLLDEVEDLEESRNLLLVVSYKRTNNRIEMLRERLKGVHKNEHPISGIIMTGDENDPNAMEKYNIDTSYFEKYEIPVITTSLDTLGTFTKFNQIEVKINISTPWKVSRAMELIKKNVDLDLIFNSQVG